MWRVLSLVPALRKLRCVMRDAVRVWCVPGCGHRCRQNGDTALMAAMRKSDEKHLDVVISLLSAGASCSVPNAVRAPPRVPAFVALLTPVGLHVGARWCARRMAKLPCCTRVATTDPT